jgi:hypothetical protein
MVFNKLISALNGVPSIKSRRDHLHKSRMKVRNDWMLLEHEISSASSKALQHEVAVFGDVANADMHAEQAKYWRDVQAQLGSQLEFKRIHSLETDAIVHEAELLMTFFEVVSGIANKERSECSSLINDLSKLILRFIDQPCSVDELHRKFASYKAEIERLEAKTLVAYNHHVSIHGSPTTSLQATIDAMNSIHRKARGAIKTLEEIERALDPTFSGTFSRVLIDFARARQGLEVLRGIEEELSLTAQRNLDQSLTWKNRENMARQEQNIDLTIQCETRARQYEESFKVVAVERDRVRAQIVPVADLIDLAADRIERLYVIKLLAAVCLAEGFEVRSDIIWLLNAVFRMVAQQKIETETEQKLEQRLNELEHRSFPLYRQFLSSEFDPLTRRRANEAWIELRSDPFWLRRREVNSQRLNYVETFLLTIRDMTDQFKEEDDFLEDPNAFASKDKASSDKASSYKASKDRTSRDKAAKSSNAETGATSGNRARNGRGSRGRRKRKRKK